MQYRSFAVFGLIGAVLSSGCSGGGGGSSTPVPGAPQVTATPINAPTATPTSAPASTVLATQTIDGGAAFVTSAGLPVYVSSGDSPGVSNCTGGCLAVWPFVAPPAGALPAPWSSFKRSDDGAMQLEYNGAPLYTFAQDSPGVVAGNGVNGFSLARPLATATSSPTAAATPTQSPTNAPTATPSAKATPTPSGYSR
jgi:predicted lipoprotein with Yx(FWY)xxD motif